MKRISNHYVPKFYLRNFSSNEKNIGAYLLKKDLFIPKASIKSQACQDYLYGKDGKIEEMFMKIERDSSKVLRQIIETDEIPDQNNSDYHLLLLFMLLSEARNLKTADSISNMIDFQMKLLIKMQLDRGQISGISHDDLESVKISHEIPNLLPIQTSTKILPILLDLKCCLIINNTDRSFITSDNPLVRYNLMYIKRYYQLRGYGFGNMGIQLFYPINPRLCICVFDHTLYDCQTDMNGNIAVNKGKQIDELNKLFYLNSYKSIFFHDETKESYIRRIVNSAIHDSGDLNKEISVFGDDKNKLIQFSKRQVNQRINLSMFSINKKFIKTPLPKHMAGPMRPLASQFLDENEPNLL